MSVYSMTGYYSAKSGHTARPVSTDADPAPRSATAAAVTVELRSVNNRFLDLSLKLPDEFRGLDPALRELLSAAFRRGKLELRLTRHDTNSDPWPDPQMDQLHRLAAIDARVRSWLPQAAPLSVHEVLGWCRTSAQAVPLDDAVLDVTKACIAGLQQARQREGQRLSAVLLGLLDQLHALAARAEPLVPAVVQRQQQRFVERWNEALALTGGRETISAAALQERAVNEAAAFAIRIDVAEELARLRAHIDEIASLLRKGGEVGKRCDFIVQELLREANTLGSKAATLELTQIAVDMKVAIEQMREQVQNLE